MKPSELLATYLEIPPAKAAKLFSEYSTDRERLLESFEYLAMTRRILELKNNEWALTEIEGVLFNVVCVTRYNGDIDQCRKRIAIVLAVFANPKLFWLHDPRLCGWAVGASLVVERNAQRKGLNRLLRSRQIEMLDRVIADCQAHDGFPEGLADRLRILESHGVFFPSDIYVAVAADHENANAALARYKANGCQL